MPMTFSAIQRREKFMTNMVKMLSRREWEEVAQPIIHSIYLSHFSVEEPLVVRLHIWPFSLNKMLSYKLIFNILTGILIQEAAAHEEEGRNMVRMWCILWRFLWRTYTMAQAKNSPFQGMLCAKNVKGISPILAYYIFLWIVIKECSLNFFMVLCSSCCKIIAGVISSLSHCLVS